jgi:hypothetical protein
MHARCFGRALKRWQDFFILSIPSNSTMFLFVLLAFAAGAVAKRDLVSVVVVGLLALIRVAAWLLWERPLPEFVDAGPSLEESDPDGPLEPTGMRCETCGEDVRAHRDLIVTLRFLQPVLMHSWCWARGIRTLDAMRTGRVPLNGNATLLQIGVLVVIAVFHQLATKGLSMLPFLLPGFAFALLVPALVFAWARRYDRRLPA